VVHQVLVEMVLLHFQHGDRQPLLVKTFQELIGLLVVVVDRLALVVKAAADKTLTGYLQQLPMEPLTQVVAVVEIL
jgi:hypothetical protein